MLEAAHGGPPPKLSYVYGRTGMRSRNTGTGRKTWARYAHGACSTAMVGTSRSRSGIDGRTLPSSRKPAATMVTGFTQIGGLPVDWCVARRYDPHLRGASLVTTGTGPAQLTGQHGQAWNVVMASGIATYQQTVRSTVGLARSLSGLLNDIRIAGSAASKPP